MKSTLSARQIPRGFRFAATACGLKKTGGLDLALIAADAPAAAAAVFTTNRVQAAPVKVSGWHLQKSRGLARAIIVNSGNANCSTGGDGIVAAGVTASTVAYRLKCDPAEVLVCSTGVIGVPLKVDKILKAIPELSQQLDSRARAFESVTRAIMTTDTRPKWAAASCRIGGRTVRLLGCAKGAGMIHPQMATMLSFIVTDATISPALLRRALRDVAGRTFNCITVDGDTSTNDTVAVLASGSSGARVVGADLRVRPLHQGARAGTQAHPYAVFVAALEKVCRSLALAIVADGEGAQCVVEISVRVAASVRAADSIARTIANSPLVKTAFAGADPNWGRILAAAGRAPLAAHEGFDPERVTIRVAGIQMYARGRALPFDERLAHKKMSEPYVKVEIDLGVANRKTKSEKRKTARKTSPSSLAPSPSATIWTCDFNHDYVTINASYRT